MDEQWYGYRMEISTFEGKQAVIVFPKEEADIGILAIKTEYWGAFPEAVELDLLSNGFSLCYIENDNRWGTDVDLDRKARFIRHVSNLHRLGNKVVAIGMSCGGLIAIKLAAKYPELVSCLYLDAPVLNYLSCPCGFGDAIPLDNGEGIKEILSALGLSSVSELIGYRQMPLDALPALIRNQIPVIMVAGGQDRFVPYHENGAYLQRAYEGKEIDCEVYIKPNGDHHPHGLSDNYNVIRFILAHAGG